MLKGYENADETFQQWTSTGQLSDFKVNKRVALNSFPSLRKVQPGAEYKYASVGDRGEDIVLATYGEIFSITRQAIINDDLSAFTKIPATMGRAAIRTIGDLVYAILTSNPDMSDDVSLFHAAHKNYVVGASSALGVGSVSAGRTSMKLQKDGSGNVLNIMPQFLLVPAALELDADSLMTDTVYPGKTNGQKNPIAGMATTIADPRLDAASTTAWYLAASQAFDTIEVAYLDGNSSPFIDQIEGWSVDGTSMKVRIDAGVSPLDFRTMYKSKGAA
jgi:phage major head subunit gpT-like protein